MQHLKCNSVFMFGVYELNFMLLSVLKYFYRIDLYKNKPKIYFFIHIFRNKVYEAEEDYIENIWDSIIGVTILHPPQVQ